MPPKLRPREWDGLALLSSVDELASIREEEEQDKGSPGVHVDSAAASGTTLGLLVKDLQDLDVEGPLIPDPERIRLLRHAENSRGGLPIYPIEPGIEDEDWANWQSRWADEQVRFRNLLVTIGRSRRWSKARNRAIPKIARSKWVNPDLGAAAAVCAAWWSEERIALTDELIAERDRRVSSRLRGALADLRGSTINMEAILLAPVLQAYLPSLENSLIACEAVEVVGREA